MNTRGYRGIALALTLSASCLAFTENYLIVHTVDSAFANDVRARIIGTGLISGNVDLFSATSVTPSLAQLQSYDAVFVFSANGFQNASRLGNNLAEYADGGGGVVVAPLTTTSSGSFTITGRFATEGYSPFSGGAVKQYITRRLGTVHDSEHPLMDGVTSFNGGSASLHNQVSMSAGAVRIADYDNGVPLVAFKQVGSSHVVGLNFFPPSSAVDSGFWVSSTHGARLMANALKFSEGISNVAPQAVADTFSVEAGDSLSVNAPGLLSNDFDADADTLSVADEDGALPGVQPVAVPQNGSLTLNLDGSFSYTPNSGFKGTDTFSYRVTDGTASSAAATVTIQVADTTAPVISGTPDNQMVSATGPSGASLTYTPPTAHDNVDGTVTVQSSHASGTTFPLGLTVVTFTASDSEGNTTQSSFTVTVSDTTAPVISGTPADLLVIATSTSGAVVNYLHPSAVDDVDGVVAVTSSAPSGSIFALGITTVTFTCTDAAGNASSTSFHVWVRYSTSALSASGNEQKGLKAGSVTQLRFTMMGDSAPITDATGVVSVLVGNNVVRTLQVTYDPVSGGYGATWKTKGLAVGDYVLRLELGDGVERTLNVRLR